MKYNPDKFTYGCELEFADVDRFAKLPDGCTFDGKDHTIVNSNGIATDPKARTSTIGGEINTKATSTIDEQVISSTSPPSRARTSFAAPASISSATTR